MNHKIRQVHSFNVKWNQIYAATTNVDPDGLQNRKPILKKNKTKSTFFFVGPNWLLSMDGHDKLIGYQNSTFQLTVMGAWSESKMIVYTGFNI